MPTLKNVLDAFQTHLGLPKSRVGTVARRLQEAEILPSGAPGVAPVLDIYNVTDLLVGVASDVPLHRVADAVRAFATMTPAGADLLQVPESLRTDARAELVSIAMMGATDDEIMPDLHIEFVSTWPELTIHVEKTLVRRFRLQGSLSGHWGAAGHRKSTVIEGRAIAAAMRALFGEKHK